MASEIIFYKTKEDFDTSDLPFSGWDQLEEVYGTRKPYISYEMMDFVGPSQFGYGDVEVEPLLKFVEGEQEALRREGDIDTFIEVLKGLDKKIYKIVGSRVS